MYVGRISKAVKCVPAGLLCRNQSGRIVLSQIGSLSGFEVCYSRCNKEDVERLKCEVESRLMPASSSLRSPKIAVGTAKISIVEKGARQAQKVEVAGFIQSNSAARFCYVQGVRLSKSELREFGIAAKNGLYVRVIVERVFANGASTLKILARLDEDLRVLSDMRTKPAWRNMKWLKPSIDAIYAERDEISARAGIPHEVDHIDPITHPLLCGLTVPWNLQVISATENRRKGNRIQGV